MTVEPVEVHLFAAARTAVGASVVVAEAGSLSDILDVITADAPAFAAVRSRCSFLLDGTAVHLADTTVPPGSRVDVLPPFSGG